MCALPTRTRLGLASPHSLPYGPWLIRCSQVGKGCLVLSDALNHSSIVAGVRQSGAKVKVR